MSFPVVPTPDPGVRLSAHPSWDESARPAGPAPEPGRTYSSQALSSGRHLVDIHDHLRAELEQVRGLVDQVLDGSTDAAVGEWRHDCC